MPVLGTSSEVPSALNFYLKAEPERINCQAPYKITLTAIFSKIILFGR